MIKWVKKKIDAFLWWIDDDMNVFFVVVVLVGVLAYCFIEWQQGKR